MGSPCLDKHKLGQKGGRGLCYGVSCATKKYSGTFGTLFLWACMVTNGQLTFQGLAINSIVR